MNESAKVYSAMRRFSAELVVIVAGVLIALAIDEWRQNLQDANLESTYIVQLIADLQATEEAVLAVDEYNSESLDAVIALLEAFEGHKELDLVQLVDLLDQIFGFDNPVPVLGTVDALIETGDLRLIGNSEVRSLLTKYQSVTRDYRLAPLNDWEGRHRELVLQALTIAITYNIALKNRTGMAHRSLEADVDGFLQNAQAYATLLELEYMKRVLASYRSSTMDDAVNLMRSIQSVDNSRL